MDEFLSDQEKAEQVKTWLRENGAFLIGGLALGLAALFGWNKWQDYRFARAAEASAVYEEFLEAFRSERTARAQELVDDLRANYDGSAYLDQAQLFLAKLHMDRNEADDAAAALATVVAGRGSEEMRNVARMRLARVRLHQQQHEAALEALSDADPNSAYAPRIQELRGDVYYAMGRLADARDEYRAALGPGEPGVIDRVFVQAKLDNLGAPEETAAAEPPASEADLEVPDDAADQPPGE